MKILHYSLGLPPYRAGGLTKYCMDLMKVQKKAGHQVELLWPGILSKGETKIRKKKRKYDIDNYEIINPLPVSLLGGIKDFEAYTRKMDKQPFVEFLKKQQYDVIHLHSIMGLPKEFLEAAKMMGIKVVYTSHDFFGICPTGNFMLDDAPCKYDSECKACAWCCRNATPMKKVRIKQGRLYRSIKNVRFVNNFKKIKRKQIEAANWGDNDLDKKKKYEEQGRNYKKLREYYYEMFALISEMHFNSSETQKFYREFGVTTKGQVINISNLNIGEHRKKKKLGKVIRIGFLGATSKRKGYLLLVEALNELEKEFEGQFELHIFFKSTIQEKYIVRHKPYTPKTLESVMDGIDIAIAPSICAETFSFNVQEALCYGVPVVVSSYVGAKDLLKKGTFGIVFGTTKEELKRCLEDLLKNPQKISEMNRDIFENGEVKTMEMHGKEMIDFYQS